MDQVLSEISSQAGPIQQKGRESRTDPESFYLQPAESEAPCGSFTATTHPNSFDFKFPWQLIYVPTEVVSSEETGPATEQGLFQLRAPTERRLGQLKVKECRRPEDIDRTMAGTKHQQHRQHTDVLIWPDIQITYDHVDL